MMKNTPNKLPENYKNELQRCKDVLIEVTQEDLNNGRAFMAAHCPIALAVKRKFPDLQVSVGTQSVRIFFYGKYRLVEALWEADLSTNLYKLRQHFDMREKYRGKIEPISATLRFHSFKNHAHNHRFACGEPFWASI